MQRTSVPSQAFNSTPNTGRIPWIDVAKGMSILLVVFLHAHVFLDARQLSSDIYLTLNTLFNPVRMPLFFAVSGLLAGSALAKGAPFVIQKKIVVFAGLFVLWSGIHVLYFTYVPWHPFVSFTDTLVSSWLHGFVRPETEIWFIWALAIYFAFVLGCRNSPLLATGVALAAGAIGASNVALAWGYNIAQQNLLTYLPFFVVPALFGSGALKRYRLHAGVLVLAGGGLAGLSKVGLSVSDWSVLDGLLGMSKLAGGLAVGVGVALLMTRHQQTRDIFSYLGQHTLAIYLLHPLLWWVAIAGLQQLPQAALVVLYGVPLATVFAVGASLVLETAIRQAGFSWLFQPSLANGVVLKRAEIEKT